MKHKLLQASHEMYLKQFLRNASFTEQKFLCFFKSVLLTQELDVSVHQLSHEKELFKILNCRGSSIVLLQLSPGELTHLITLALVCAN